MEDFFDFNDSDLFADSKSKISIDKKILNDTAQKRIIKNNELHFKKYNALSNLCTEPKQGEQWRIVTEKQFNAFALILHILEARVIDEMYLAVYRINEESVESIIKFIDTGKIKKATFIISSFFNQTKKPEKWALRLKEYCKNNPKCTHIYCHNHSKVFCAKTGQDYFVFEGSGNMSDNARIEQYLYENNKLSFDFHKQWMTELCDKYKGEF